MKTLTLIKPQLYDPGSPNINSYRAVALRQKDPPISMPKKGVNVRSSNALCSPSLRAKQTAFASGYNKIETSNLLFEVLFDLSNLLSEDEYEHHGSTLVRQRFLEAFIKDELSESHKELQQRID